MSSTYSSNLRIELIGSGDQAGTWGTTTNSNLAYVLDTAIAGYQAVTVTSTDQALTYVNGPTSTASLNQSVYAMLKFNSAGAASNIYAPPVSKQYIVWNNSSYTITVYNSTVIGNTTAAGTGIAVAAGNKMLIWSDGTNFYDVKSNNITGVLAVANGGTGVTTSTGSGSVVLSTSPSLQQVTSTITTLNNFTASSYGSIKALFETATITGSAPSSTTNFDVTTQATQYYTSNTTTNFTLNFRANAAATVTAGSFVVGTVYTIATVGTTDYTLIGAASNSVGVVFTATGVGSGTGTATTGTLNSILATGQSVTCTLLITNGSTAYYPSTIQVDGVAVTPKWQNGISASSVNVNSTVAYTFVIIKTASATYTVLGSQTKFA